MQLFVWTNKKAITVHNTHHNVCGVVNKSHVVCSIFWFLLKQTFAKFVLGLCTFRYWFIHEWDLSRQKNNSRTTSSWATFRDRWFSPHFPNLHYFGMIASKIGKHEIYTHPQFRRMNVIWCFLPQRTQFHVVDDGENILIWHSWNHWMGA